ncbi:MAG TPA: glycine oxidase ThiO [Candidatus Competibacter sp.]|nr:glycine oxidase ThiO [Candidatus Competibacter sp.]HUM93814.1 glycine oxidase ThiO [Candidatus Competibacter sp.]
MHHQHIAVVGAGIVGLTQALWLQRQGHRITLFERGGEALDHHCSHVGAGMLSPYCELSEAEAKVARWGTAALPLWRRIVPTLARPVHISCEGTLVVAHARDRAGMQHLAERIERAGFGSRLRWLRREALRELEPELEGRFGEGLYLAPEGEIDPRSLLPALVETLRQDGATLRFATEVEQLASGAITVGGTRHAFDWVLDCRGLAASDQMAQLRGVRGEILTVRTSEVRLSRPIRMMHPRYPLYIVPRPSHRFVVGATSIESDSLRPATVRSALELLSAAYALHPAFAEAEIVELNVQCRPTFPDHLPRIILQDKLLRINGLYRHGYLLSPLLAETVAAFVSDRRQLEETAALWGEATV